MRIGEIAQRAGVSTKTVRFYESQGLLAVERLSNGYRDYDDSHVTLVREIQELGALGIPVQQTRPFLDCLVAGNPHGDDCSESVATYRDTIQALESRIADLSSRRDRLRALMFDAVDRTEPACEFASALASLSDPLPLKENH